MPLSPVHGLGQKDCIKVFRLATRGLVHHYGEQLQQGMGDNDLKAALEQVLGIFGGSGGPNRLSVTHTASGLRIWGGWHVVNHVTEKPLFSGMATIAMAREVYGIPDPEQDQLALL